MTEFTYKYADLAELMEFSAAKPFKTGIDVAPYDLPRELTEQRKS